MMAKSVRALFLFGFSAICSVSSLPAQVSTSSITGVVTDSTGAVVANAKVEAKNDDTGVVFTQNTTNAGTYAFPSLTPGSYSITVTMSGFQTFTSAHNVLTVGTPLVVDVALKVGTVGQTVEVVESNYQRLETSNATVSDIMDPPFPTVEGDQVIDVVVKLLSKSSPAVLVRGPSGIEGIVTRSDLLTFLMVRE